MRTRSLLLLVPFVVFGCGSSGSGDGTDNGGDSAPVDTAPPLETAKNLTIGEIALFQGPKAELMKDGAATTHLAPVIVYRPGVVRVYLQPGDAWTPRDVTGRLTLHTDGGDVVLTDTKTIIAGSTESRMDSTLDFNVPPGAIDGDTTYDVTLLTAPGQPDGPADGATYPATGTPDALNAVWVGGTFHLVLVPYTYEGRTPDTSDPSLQIWHDAILRDWPIVDTDVHFHDPVPWTQSISAFGGGWSQILQYTVMLRQKEGAADDVFYYGIFTPASSFSVFCAGGCVGGLAGLPTGGGVNPYTQAAVGLGWTDEFELGTMAQELAHTVGRLHAPCGNGVQNVDPKFPYKSGNVGVWGWDIIQQQLVEPATADFMSYCSPVFVSDYTFGGIAGQLQKIAAKAGNVHYAASTNYRLIDVAPDGSARWGEVMPMRMPPAADSTPVAFVDSAGKILLQTKGWYHPYDRIEGGMLVVPDAPEGAVAVRFEGISPKTLAIPQ